MTKTLVMASMTISLAINLEGLKIFIPTKVKSNMSVYMGGYIKKA